jgi:diacylglycerol kinase (ATP)
LLLAFETMNTAIEKLCNKLTTDFDPKIRDIKDLSSAAVFIILIVLIIIFLITLPDNFLSLKNMFKLN